MQPLPGTTTVELFGGAMRCVLPERFQDVSRWRQVPDAQEVYADADCDESVIIELVEAEAEQQAEQLDYFLFSHCRMKTWPSIISEIWQMQTLPKAR